MAIPESKTRRLSERIRLGVHVPPLPLPCPMFSTVFLILFLVLSSSANASPIRRLIAGKIPLGFSAVLDPTGGPSIVDADRARAQALGKGSGQTDSVSAKNAVMGYTAQVGIGDPPTQCESSTCSVVSC